ncbi:carboxypeptidase S [Vararia minispora EC-137]|uniref:Carboxypeptidase S n=1 Tax=Vararia minispora EC-137 TaxID=1314806 RepID=A0ACB8QUY4_9AGAM|nr:carboxypeptidase S [Vararia minispora EC-137]
MSGQSYFDDTEKRALEKGLQAKEAVQLDSSHVLDRKCSWVRTRRILALICACTFLLGQSAYSYWPSARSSRPYPLTSGDIDYSALCPQSEEISPSANAGLAEQLDKLYSQREVKEWAYENLGGAVRIPTETYDDIPPPGEDSRWDTFAVLHKYFEKRFPLVHSKLQVTKINMYALVFHWQGSDESLKPIILTGHQDVVPVLPDTVDQWIQPPFSGYYDGTWIWGRGSCDDKSGTLASLTAVETLLKQGFKPKRTVVLAYGIDEERGGEHGAGHIAEYLLKVYGEDGFAVLVDEGGGYKDLGNVIISSPNTAEKGKLNVQIEVTTLGGHSSVPPPHTGIGYLSTLITSLEANPFPVELKRSSTYFKTLQCAAAYDDSLPSDYRELVAKASIDDIALAQVQEYLLAQRPDFYRAKFGTTQAIDLIHGGVKVNALPEHVWTVANHRIADWSNPAEVRSRYIDVLSPVATELNLTLHAFGLPALPSLEQSRASAGLITLSDIYDEPLAPAPVTPTFGSPAWELLSGTILSTLGSAIRSDVTEKPAYVGPELSIGNTDTHYYWNLTRNIFRYGHLGEDDRYNGAHTVNEAIKAEGYLEKVRFYSRFILNADETHLLDSY